MPITFTINAAKGYFLSRYEGSITDDEFINAYVDFYEGDQWRPEFNELVDVSRVDASNITADALRVGAEITQRILQQHGVESVKIAVYAPHDLPYGLARMYSVYAEESPETVQVFRDLAAAKQWLETDEPNSL